MAHRLGRNRLVHVPIRTCIACRRSAGKRELIRLVVDRDAVQVDPSGSRPGRGAYLCALARCVDAALRRDGAAIRRALRLGHTLQLSQGHATLDVDALRAQLDANWSAATSVATTQKRFCWLEDSFSPQAREGVGA
jgi:predicted RNA-binding protein YlxR (DUF448 family)